MEHLEDIFHKKGKVYDGNTEMVYGLFKTALFMDDEETAKALIFPGSPVLSAEIKVWGVKESFLHTLCSGSANSVIAQLLIDFGINIDKKNGLGNTALHLNVEYQRSIERDDKQRHLNMIKVLLKNGANRNIRNRFGLIPIQLSLFMGKLEVAEEFLKEEDKLPNVTEVDRISRCRHLVKCLLQEKNDWNVPNSNYSVLLHFLLLENDEETFEYVAKNTKFDANAVNHEGNMLLHLVAERGTPRMIRTLIKMGADPDAVEIKYGTPLITAILKPRREVFHCLLDCGASVNKIDDGRGRTFSPLHYAVCVQSLEMVQTLVKLGADVNARTNHRSPLLIACGSIDSRKWHPVNFRGEMYDAFTRKTDLFNDIHVSPFNVKIVEFLLDQGADIEAKNASNRTSLDQACKVGRLDIVKLLLSRGAKINQGDVSTLHYAVRGENAAIVKLILEQGANVNYRCAPEKMLWDDPDYETPPPRTPLECALLFIRQDSNCKDIIELLTEYGVNVNVADPVRRESPLHLACLSDKSKNSILRLSISRRATISLLLGHNADVNALDCTGSVPLRYALRNYTLINGVNTTGNSPNRLKPDFVALIAFIARMIERKECLIKQNLILLEDESVRPIFQACVDELNLMKRNICESRNFSYFNILCKDIQCLGSALKNEDIFKALNSAEYKKEFPIYGEYLEDRIRKATVRQKLVDLTIVLFKKYVYKNISVELVLNILIYLNLQSFKNFAEACFVDVE